MRILILGSAPSAETWIQKYKDYLDFFDTIATINNAWYLLRDLDQCDPTLDPNNITHEWYRPPDFMSGPRLCTHPPTTEDMEKLTWIDYRTRWTRPFKYNRNAGGTMLLNVLYCLFNRYFENPHDTNLYVVGCDADYSAEKTHFYGKGKMVDDTTRRIVKNAPDLEGKAADPLRFGRDWFIKECHIAKSKVPRMPITNLSEHHTTLLPFERQKFSDTLVIEGILKRAEKLIGTGPWLSGI